MRAHLSTAGVDAAVAALAGRQFGRITREQLFALGLDRGGIGRRLAAGRLHRVHAGVYAVGHTAPQREARWFGAVLACGEGAVLSHRSAATLWRIRDGEGPHPDVTAPTRRRHPDIAVHSASLTPEERTIRLTIPVTSVARTIVDLAHELPDDEVRRTVREAQFLRLFDLAATRRALARRPSKILRELLNDLTLTESFLEDRLHDVIRRHRLPEPTTQHELTGRRLDFVWPDHRVVVETDGWRSHGTRSAFQSDRAATNALQLAGYTVLRFTAADLRRRPAQVAGQIAAALGYHPAPHGRRPLHHHTHRDGAR